MSCHSAIFIFHHFLNKVTHIIFLDTPLGPVPETCDRSTPSSRATDEPLGQHKHRAQYGTSSRCSNWCRLALARRLVLPTTELLSDAAGAVSGVSWSRGLLQQKKLLQTAQHHHQYPACRPRRQQSSKLYLYGRGISMVALSDSKTTSVSPSLTSSPTATQIFNNIDFVITANIWHLNHQLRRSWRVHWQLALQVQTSSATGSSFIARSFFHSNMLAVDSSSATSISAIASPTLTVAPSSTRYFVNTPLAGTRDIHGCFIGFQNQQESSTSTLSPGAKPSSITSTVSAPPRSGTTTVCIVTLIPLLRIFLAGCLKQLFSASCINAIKRVMDWPSQDQYQMS